MLTGGGSQLTGLPELAANMFGRPVRLGRPRAMSGLPAAAGAPDFAAAIGLLLHWARGDDRLSGRAEQRFLAYRHRLFRQGRRVDTGQFLIDERLERRIAGKRRKGAGARDNEGSEGHHDHQPQSS